MHLAVLLICVAFVNTADVTPNLQVNASDATPEPPVDDTRRILKGRPCGSTRPYMVYLRPLDKEALSDPTWTCGGVIIHAQYILTSAACIEDANQFLVVSGTNKWIPNDEINECIAVGGKKAISKCVPKEYVFDGHVFDNTKWMRDDIAIVKVEEEFNFEKRVRGCDFVPEIIPYNNITDCHEDPGTVGSIAGWGTTDFFSAVGSANNSQELLEVDVKIMSHENCKKLWPARYHHIIDHNVICTQDSAGDVSNVCGKDEECAPSFIPSRKANENGTEEEPYDFEAYHIKTAHKSENDSRRTVISGGGFCNNDHGGPLVVGQGKTSVVTGIISACQHNNLNHRCFGPYLYTSIWKNKHLINCILGDTTLCPLDEWLSCCALHDQTLA